MLGLGVSAAALVARQGILWFEGGAAAGRAAGRMGRQFYQGGFESVMTRAEAAKILGVRQYAPKDKVKDAHRKLMMANHPDSGGSRFIATKVNEAKDVMMGKKPEGAGPGP